MSNLVHVVDPVKGQFAATWQTQQEPSTVLVVRKLSTFTMLALVLLSIKLLHTIVVC